MMADVTLPFNTTTEFYGELLHDLSYAFGNSTLMGLFFGAAAVGIVHHHTGPRASIPTAVGVMMILPKMGLLPSWVGTLPIIAVPLFFGIYVYERFIGRD